MWAKVFKGARQTASGGGAPAPLWRKPGWFVVIYLIIFSGSFCFHECQFN